MSDLKSIVGKKDEPVSSDCGEEGKVGEGTEKCVKEGVEEFHGIWP